MVASQTGLARDLEILDAVAAAAPTGLRVTDLANVTNREKSQISRAVSRLIDAGLLVRERNSPLFNLGPRLFAIARYSFESQLVSAARPEMHILVQQLGETTHLTALQGLDVVTIHSESPSHGFRALSWLGISTPAYATSAGRVLLSGLSDSEITRAFPLAKKFENVAVKSKVKNGAELLTAVKKIRRDGFCKVIEEYESDLVGASVPIHDFAGDIIAALNVAAPKGRFESHLDTSIKKMTIAAKNIEEKMGAVRRR
jgi:DNA-binding IclR family transcriptional regulator